MSKTKRWIEKQIEDGNYTLPNFGDYIHAEEYQKELEAYQEYPIQKVYDEYEKHKLKEKYQSDK